MVSFELPIILIACSGQIDCFTTNAQRQDTLMVLMDITKDVDTYDGRLNDFLQHNRISACFPCSQKFQFSQL